MSLTQNPQSVFADFLNRLAHLPTLDTLSDHDCHQSGMVKYIAPPEGIVLKYSDGISECDTLVVRCQQSVGGPIINIKLYDEYNEEVVNATVYDTLGGTLEDVILTILAFFGYGLFANAFIEYYEKHDYRVPANLKHQKVEGNVNMYDMLKSPEGATFIEENHLEFINVVDKGIEINNLVIPLKDVHHPEHPCKIHIKSNPQATLTCYSLFGREHMIFTQFGNLLKQFNAVRQIIASEIYNPLSLECDALEEFIHYGDEFTALTEALTMLYKVDYQKRVEEMSNV